MSREQGFGEFQAVGVAFFAVADNQVFSGQQFPKRSTRPRIFGTRHRVSRHELRPLRMPIDYITNQSFGRTEVNDGRVGWQQVKHLRQQVEYDVDGSGQHHQITRGDGIGQGQHGIDDSFSDG